MHHFRCEKSYIKFSVIFDNVLTYVLNDKICPIVLIDYFSLN